MKLSVLGFDGTIRYPPKQVWGNVEYSSWWSVGYMEVTREGEKKDACDPETRWLILRVKELRSVETSVAIYQPTKRNITEDLNLLQLVPFVFTRSKISITNSEIRKLFWVSYILFIIIIGGILVLFIYITRLASNEIFSPSNQRIQGCW